jgi:hypothetical protein
MSLFYAMVDGFIRVGLSCSAASWQDDRRRPSLQRYAADRAQANGLNKATIFRLHRQRRFDRRNILTGTKSGEPPGPPFPCRIVKSLRHIAPAPPLSLQAPAG